jgi:hypothetical protein
VREALLRQSILYCTSQLNFSREKSAELQAGLVGTTIVGKASLTEFWQGALLDKEFRDHLLKEGVSANDFQNMVSGCQHDELSRSGYYNMIQGTASGYQYGYQWRR